jgi:tetratricopeptide (TPR) repeat protein
MLMRSVVPAAVLALFLTGLLAAQDTVTTKDGPKTGVVQEWTTTGIKLTIAGGGGTTTIKGDDVIPPVSWGNLPKEFKQAEDDFNRGKWEDAAAGYAAFLEKKSMRVVLRAEALLKQGTAFQNADKADDAINSFKALLQEVPQTHGVEEADNRIVHILVRTNKGPDAIAFLEAEEARVQKLPESGAIVERLKLLKARVLLATGDTKKAKAEATTLAGGSSAGAGGAKVLLAQIALAEKDGALAEKLFNEAKKTVTAKSDRAACWNGLGSILLEAGKQKHEPAPIREALQYFLRTAFVEIPDAGDSTEPHETGLFNGAVCFQDLGELGSPAPAGKPTDTKGSAEPKAADQAQTNNLNRARELFRRLLREYPQTKYASEAQQRLQKLGG